MHCLKGADARPFLVPEPCRVQAERKLVSQGYYCYTMYQRPLATCIAAPLANGFDRARNPPVYLPIALNGVQVAYTGNFTRQRARVSPAPTCSPTTRCPGRPPRGLQVRVVIWIERCLPCAALTAHAAPCAGGRKTMQRSRAQRHVRCAAVDEGARCEHKNRALHQHLDRAVSTSVRQPWRSAHPHQTWPVHSVAARAFRLQRGSAHARMCTCFNQVEQLGRRAPLFRPIPLQAVARRADPAGPRQQCGRLWTPGRHAARTRPGRGGRRRGAHRLVAQRGGADRRQLVEGHAQAAAGGQLVSGGVGCSARRRGARPAGRGCAACLSQARDGARRGRTRSAHAIAHSVGTNHPPPRTHPTPRYLTKVEAALDGLKREVDGAPITILSHSVSRREAGCGGLAPLAPAAALLGILRQQRAFFPGCPVRPCSAPARAPPPPPNPQPPRPAAGWAACS